jgi:hypothetical protein
MVDEIIADTTKRPKREHQGIIEIIRKNPSGAQGAHYS